MGDRDSERSQWIGPRGFAAVVKRSHGIEPDPDDRKREKLEHLPGSRRSFAETIAATRSVSQRMARIADDLERYIAFDRTG